jgi:outer membrane lipoprotein-sorting protein
MLVVEKPDRVSFRYDPPNANRVVSDGKSLRVYVAEDRQMFVQPVAGAEYPGAIAFMMGRGMRGSFSFTFNDKAQFSGGPVLLGKPTAPTPHYDVVVFYIDDALRTARDPGTIRRVVIVDAQGNKNRFDFTSAAWPEKVDPAEFAFTPPPGTNVTER